MDAAFRGRKGRPSAELPRAVGASVGPALVFLSAGLDREAYPMATSPDRNHGGLWVHIFFYSIMNSINKILLLKN